jgi:hypothetical protein
MTEFELKNAVKKEIDAPLKPAYEIILNEYCKEHFQRNESLLLSDKDLILQTASSFFMACAQLKATVEACAGKTDTINFVGHQFLLSEL